MVELHVLRDGIEEMVYVLKSASEAAEYMSFLSGFWADAQFVVQPVRH